MIVLLAAVCFVFLYYNIHLIYLFNFIYSINGKFYFRLISLSSFAAVIRGSVHIFVYIFLVMKAVNEDRLVSINQG